MARVCYRGRRNNTFRIDRKKMQICSSNAVIKKRPSLKAKKPNFDDECYLRVQAFVDEPVSFNFGDADYGNKMFDDLGKEQAWDNLNSLGYRWGSREGIHRIVEGLKHSDEDIYTLSSLEDLIHSFLKDNLL